MACVISWMYVSTMRLVNMYDATFDIEYAMNGEILSSILNNAESIVRITYIATFIVSVFLFICKSQWLGL